jgi:LysM repeat protein
MMRAQGLLVGLVVLVLAAGCVQPAGNQLPATDIATFIPTWTLVPSSTPETVIVTVEITSTPDPFAAQEAGTGGAEAQPFTSEQTEELAQQPTIDPGAALDPDQMRATQIIQGSTSTAAAIATGTAQALNIGSPFLTPTATSGLAPAEQATQILVAGADCIEEVRAGDNLFRISQRYGLTVTEIATRNGITNRDLIFPGDRLTIPGCGTTGYRPLPTSTPTPSRTPAAGTVTDTTTGGTTTGDTSGGVFLTFTPAPLTGQCGTHTVAEGQTLFQIARQYGVSVSDMAAANGIVNVDLIDMGDELIVPC